MTGMVAEKQNGEADGKEDAPVAESEPGNETADTGAYVRLAAK